MAADDPRDGERPPRHRRAPRTHGSRRRRVRRPALVVLGVLIAAVLGAGLASAAWISTGGGSATARAGQALAPTTTAVPGTAITSGLLYPGGTGDVKITVNNPNPYPVKVASVTGAGAATGSGGTGTCGTSGVTLTSATPGTAIPAAGSALVTLPGAAAMSTASDTGCQNATFSLPVTVAVESG